MRIWKYWKPVGAVTSLRSEEPFSILKHGLLTSNHLQMINSAVPPIHPVGRLDKDSSGLLLLTDDPLMVIHLTRTYSTSSVDRKDMTTQEKEESYGSKYEKIYHITTEHHVADHLLSRLRGGVMITTRGRRVGAVKSKKKTLPCKIERSMPLDVSDVREGERGRSPEGNSQRRGSQSLDLYITLREGRNRQIRKMIGSVGHSVVTLCRLSFGKVTLSGLKGPGDLLPLSEKEMECLVIPEGRGGDEGNREGEGV